MPAERAPKVGGIPGFHQQVEEKQRGHGKQSLADDHDGGAVSGGLFERHA